MGLIEQVGGVGGVDGGFPESITIPHEGTGLREGGITPGSTDPGYPGAPAIGDGTGIYHGDSGFAVAQPKQWLLGGLHRFVGNGKRGVDGEDGRGGDAADNRAGRGGRLHLAHRRWWWKEWNQ